MHGKQNYPQIALCWIANAARHFSPGHPRIKMGETSTPYPADIAEPLEPVQAIPEASQFIIYDTHQEHAWMLMLSTDDSYFNGRRECRDVVMADAWLRSEWFPWPDVGVITWLPPFLWGQLRIHQASAPRQLKAVKTGSPLISLQKQLPVPTNITFDDLYPKLTLSGRAISIT
ncbi:hypothetical protein R2233_001318 [Cronobacter turicensis]|nr:hypothetical protein [Cronobacter turicensis]